MFAYFDIPIPKHEYYDDKVEEDECVTQTAKSNRKKKRIQGHPNIKDLFSMKETL